MEEPQCSRATLPASLPPGCRFYPSQEQLLCYYLPNKNAGGDFHGCDLIRELDLYDYDPFQLPEIACFSYGYRGRKRHWYCYTARVSKDARRKTRVVKSGYWMRKGGVRNVLNGGGNVVLGTRTTFVFYIGSPKNASRTNWMLHEYALVDHLKASFVVCRVFLKACHKTSVSENGLSSCAEEAFSVVRDIGIQHDGYVSPDIIGTQMRDDCSLDRKILVSPLTPASSKLDENQNAAASASVATFQCCAGPQDSETGKFSGLPGGGAIFVEELASRQHLISILEEDFIELDDLA